MSKFTSFGKSNPFFFGKSKKADFVAQVRYARWWDISYHTRRYCTGELKAVLCLHACIFSVFCVVKDLICRIRFFRLQRENSTKCCKSQAYRQSSHPPQAWHVSWKRRRRRKKARSQPWTRRTLTRRTPTPTAATTINTKRKQRNKRQQRANLTKPRRTWFKFNPVITRYRASF